MATNLDTIIYSLLGGILPALVWLAFWLREDKLHPEPRRLLIRTFILGMIAVICVLPFQRAVQNMVEDLTLAFFFWAVIEEGFKLGAAWFGGINSRDDDEPLDPIIYMITAALGFAAFENALFLSGPIGDGHMIGTLLTGNVRFVGATLLHVISSGIIGSALAFAFYKSRSVRTIYALVAFLVAVVFHMLFNVMIMSANFGLAPALITVWIGIALLLLVFERVKTI